MSDLKLICFKCSRGPHDGTPLIKQDPKDGVIEWACDLHNQHETDSGLLAVMALIEREVKARKQDPFQSSQLH